MTLIDPNDTRRLADHITQQLQAGQSIGDALRSTAMLKECRLILLTKAVVAACNISSREAAKLIAKEVSTPEWR